jgi:hypothetical protein
MEDEKKEPKRGTLESFFASASAKKQKVHYQSISINNECLQQSTDDDDVLFSSTPETPILSTITDDDSTQQPESAEAPPSSSEEQLKSTALSSTASQISLTPVDISRSGSESPAQPKLSFYKKDKLNRSFQPHWYSKFTWIEYSQERDCVFCFYCRHFTFGTHLNIRVRACLFENSFHCIS